MSENNSTFLLNKIVFHSESIEFSLDNEDRIRQWINQVIQNANCTLIQLSYIFCSDEYLHQINVEYLQHDTYTDIITFPYQEAPQIEGDLFISIDRVRENAQTFKASFLEELQRVMIHGVLHLCGQGDKTDEEQKVMRQKEAWALEILKSKA